MTFLLLPSDKRVSWKSHINQSGFIYLDFHGSMLWVWRWGIEELKPWNTLPDASCAWLCRMCVFVNTYFLACVRIIWTPVLCTWKDLQRVTSSQKSRLQASFRLLFLRLLNIVEGLGRSSFPHPHPDWGPATLEDWTVFAPAPGHAVPMSGRLQCKERKMALKRLSHLKTFTYLFLAHCFYCKGQRPNTVDKPIPQDRWCDTFLVHPLQSYIQGGGEKREEKQS